MQLYWKFYGKTYFVEITKNFTIKAPPRLVFSGFFRSFNFLTLLFYWLFQFDTKRDEIKCRPLKKLPLMFRLDPIRHSLIEILQVLVITRFQTVALKGSRFFCFLFYTLKKFCFGEMLKLKDINRIAWFLISWNFLLILIRKRSQY